MRPAPGRRPAARGAERLDEERLPRREVVHQRALRDAGALGHAAVVRRVAILDEAARRRRGSRAGSPRGARPGSCGAVRRLRRSPDRTCYCPRSPISDRRTGGTRTWGQRDPQIPDPAGGDDDRHGGRGRRPRGDRRARCRPRREARRPPAAQGRAGAGEGVRRHARRGDEGRADAVGGRPRAGPRGGPRGVPGDPRQAPAGRRAGLFKAIEKVIEEDLGEQARRVFADIDEEPIAAASIGQVHRATLHDGRDVAVKVQYPGIAEAIHADLQNLRLGLKLLRHRAGDRHRRDRRRDPRAHRARSSTTSSRRPTTARWRARTAATRSSSSPTS